MSCSPTARWLKASLPELKLQLRLALVAGLLITVVGDRLSMASRAASLAASPVVTPVFTTDTTELVTLLLPSTSVTVTVPLAVRLPLVSVTARAALSPNTRLN